MNEGGPAFPCVKHTAIQGNKSEQQREIRFEVVPGQSRRQWLAGLAMEGLIACCSDPGLDWPDCDMVAKQAYKQADAMLTYEESEQCPPKPKP